MYAQHRDQPQGAENGAKANCFGQNTAAIVQTTSLGVQPLTMGELPGILIIHYEKPPTGSQETNSPWKAYVEALSE